MNKHSREGLDGYYAEAATWNSDRIRSVQSSRRTAWIVAAGACVVAVLEAASLMLLAPLKTVVPYTLLVDRTTGYVQALKPLDAETVAPDSALTQSFLVQYVIGRESFDRSTLNMNYRKIALFSAGIARASYLQQMQGSNPENPVLRYPAGTTVDVRVKSVSPIGPAAMLVRFETVRTDPNARPQPAAAWVAVIKYRYSAAPMRVEDRFLNPLGFQVTSYRKDPESLPPAGPDERAAPVPAAPGPANWSAPNGVAAPLNDARAAVSEVAPKGAGL